MMVKGAKVVIVCCLLVHSFVFSGNLSFVQLQSSGAIVLVSALQGLVYLIYPLVCLVTDIYFVRYKIIKFSVILHLLAAAIGVISTVVFLGLLSKYYHHSSEYYHLVTASSFIYLILGATTLISIGIFEASAIQFGIDQLLEAPSDQISAFVHWYFFSMNAGMALLQLITVGIMPAETAVFDTLLSLNISVHCRGLQKFLPVVPITVSMILQLLTTIACLCVLIRCKKHLTIEPARYNPFSTVYKVLKYAWQHKCPVNRSAFTYWEPDIPRRIDLGKRKYGGPFTTEEVEDTKMFFRVVLILISLFGFHLSGNGFTITRKLMTNMCPSEPVWMILAAAPSLLDSLVTLLAVPLLHYVLLPYLHGYIPTMTKRLGIGLALVLLQEVAGILLVWGTREDVRLSKCTTTNSDIIDCHIHWLPSHDCSDKEYCIDGHTIDGAFFWLLVPLIFRSLSYLLVFMTALEFICAQAPLRMKGILIGIWYATFCLRYLIVNVLDVSEFTLKEDNSFFILHGARGSLILLSLILYCCVAKCYRYRQRDEVVNEQFLVEEVFERRLRQAEQYENDYLTRTDILYGSVSDD